MRKLRECMNVYFHILKNYWRWEYCIMFINMQLLISHIYINPLALDNIVKLHITWSAIDWFIIDKLMRYLPESSFIGIDITYQMCLKIIHLQLLPRLRGASELTNYVICM